MGSTPVAALSPASGGGGGGTTWNPADKNANVSLSNGNLTATGTASGFEGVRGTTNTVSSKKYFEISFSAAADITQVGVAIGNASASLSTYNDSNSIGWFGSGSVFHSGATVDSAASFTAGQTLLIAFNASSNLVFFAVGAGSWNNIGADPTTGSGGISTSAVTGPFLPLLILDAVNDAATVNFGASGYAFTPPSGYGNW